jgi:hypothetical protein
VHFWRLAHERTQVRFLVSLGVMMTHPLHKVKALAIQSLSLSCLPLVVGRRLVAGGTIRLDRAVQGVDQRRLMPAANCNQVQKFMSELEQRLSFIEILRRDW